MNHDYNKASDTAVCSLQSEPVCCNLQTTRKLKVSNNKAFSQIADCGAQIADTPCNLNTNLDNSRGVEINPDCTQTPTPYRGSRDSLANAGDHYFNGGLVRRSLNHSLIGHSGGATRC